MNTNIIISALHLFQILLKSQEETRCLITIPQRPYKKNVIPLTTPIEDDKNRSYARIKTQIILWFGHHTLVQTPKKELAKIFESKKEAFCMKATIWKLDKKTKYTLPNLYIKQIKNSIWLSLT